MHQTLSIVLCNDEDSKIHRDAAYVYEYFWSGKGFPYIQDMKHFLINPWETLNDTRLLEDLRLVI